MSFTNVYAANSVSLDKESYEFGETVKIKYISDIATNVNLDLHNFKGQFVSNISNNVPVVVGLNEIQYFIPAIGPNSADDLFTIRIKEVNSTRVTKTIKFYILPSYMQVTQDSSETYTLYVVDQPLRGLFIQTLKVKAVKGDVYLKSSELADFSVLTGIPNNEVRVSLINRQIITPPIVPVNQYGVYTIPKGQYALVKFTMIAAPKYVTDYLTFKLNSISTTTINGLQTAKWYKGFQNMVTQALLVEDELF